jgi:hypothetical protein
MTAPLFLPALYTRLLEHLQQMCWIRQDLRRHDGAYLAGHFRPDIHRTWTLVLRLITFEHDVVSLNLFWLQLPKRASWQRIMEIAKTGERNPARQ